MTQTIWYAASRNGGRSETYHTDRNCRLLKNARNIQSKDLKKFPHREQCKVCADGFEPNGDSDFSHFNALLEAGENA